MMFQNGQVNFKNLAAYVATFLNNAWPFSETVVQRCSVKKVLLKISQNSQENTCARVSF